ncbi:50S ribosomal protein L28 [Demequina sp. NBRC 110054]|uniref:50S ribosomal protein L28 n=1 Tax=Demequina sp. NBRC 110054 TaxID=1570343 RepID=UPI000A077AC3|nr:50S ribosomal protein L28 [Demequina sp. NBRC 110054]
MSAQRCQVTGAVPSFGNTISHSHRRTSRRWKVNIQRKRFWVESLGRHVTLNVSTKGLKVIDRDGIDAVAARLLASGEKI